MVRTLNPLNVLKDLVAIDSVSGNEAKALRYINSYLLGLKLKSRILKSKALVCMVPGTNRQKCIIFNGHIDTVPAGEPSLWHTKPLQLTKKGDRQIGLGSSDMKAGITAMLKLAEVYAKEQPPCDICFSFVANEEVDGLGARIFAEQFSKQYYRQYRQCCAVIGEPTDIVFLGIGHRGNRMVEISVKGQSGHGSRPDQITEHAIINATALIQAIYKNFTKWEKRYQHALLGLPSVVVTSLLTEEGKSMNKFPETAKFIVDIRTTPSLHDKIIPLLKKSIGKNTLREVAADSPPAATNQSDPVILAAKKALPRLPLRIFPGATDASFLAAHNIPFVIYGPGSVAAMHTPNEFVVTDNIMRCTQDYLAIVKHYATI